MIDLGYETGTGKPVDVPLAHMAVTGMTATQYALLTSILAFARGTLSAGPGRILGAKPFSEWNQQGRVLKVGALDAKEAAAWMRGAAAVLGNDSGLSHLAAACGAPVLAIYGATDPGGSTPWGPHSRGLRNEGIPCAPCFKPDCFTQGHPCLAGIGPDQVWTELTRLISV